MKKIIITLAALLILLAACRGTEQEDFDIEPPDFPPTEHAIVQIHAGWNTSFVLLENGELWSWGGGSLPHFGAPQLLAQSEPVLLKQDVASFAVDDMHILTLTNDNRVYEWGFTLIGQADIDDEVIPIEPVVTPIFVMDNVAKIAAAGRSSLAITHDGELYGWGHNLNWMSDHVDNFSQIPLRIKENVVDVAAGGMFTLVVTSDGALYAWGETYLDGRDELPFYERSAMHRVMDNVASVSANVMHALILTPDGKLYGFGSNQSGQLGHESGNFNTPTLIGEDIAYVSAGGGHTAAITSDGVLYTWGSNNHGALGDGQVTIPSTSEYINRHLRRPETDSVTPLRIMNNVALVSAGASHTLAVTADGHLWGWGSNRYGELGQDDLLFDRYNPSAIQLFAPPNDNELTTETALIAYRDFLEENIERFGLYLDGVPPDDWDGGDWDWPRGIRSAEVIDFENGEIPFLALTISQPDLLPGTRIPFVILRSANSHGGFEVVHRSTFGGMAGFEWYIAEGDIVCLVKVTEGGGWSVGNRTFMKWQNGEFVPVLETTVDQQAGEIEPDTFGMIVSAWYVDGIEVTEQEHDDAPYELLGITDMRLFDFDWQREPKSLDEVIAMIDTRLQEVAQ